MGREIPRSMRQMTPEWLTEALGSELLRGAAVVDVTVATFPEGLGFIGELARLGLTYDDGPPDAPASVIAKIPINEPGGRMLGNMLRLYEREAAFYASMANEVRIRVPSCFHNSSDVEAGDFCLLLEDLGHLDTVDQRTGASLEQTTNILETIALFHARWDREQGAEFDWLPASDDPMILGFIDRFDEAHAKLTSEMADRIDPQIDETSLRLSKFSHEMLADMAGLPKTINHGDLRLDNMFFDGDEVVLFDWQGMMRTTPLYDVVYFLGTNVSPTVLSDHHEVLLTTYADAYAGGGGRSLSLDEMMSTSQQIWATFLVLGTVLLADLDFSSEQGLALFDANYSRTVNAGHVFDVHSYKP